MKNKPVHTDVQHISGSFRDPAGFVFKDKNNRLLRQINKLGAADFDMLMSSGLYDSLVKAKLLVPHQSVKNVKATPDAYKVIAPEEVPFISYPFEWSFSQLQDAALATIKAQQLALKHGMSLKDASAYNVQFIAGKPVLIDTLSFEAYPEGKPWQAYHQFCKHFLAPLALMAHVDLNLSQLLRVHLDGVPLDLTARLLPGRSKLRPGLAMHLFLHARAQVAKASAHQRPARPIAKQQLEAILLSLAQTVRSLKPKRSKTEWGDYYDNTNYTVAAADKKATLIRTYIKQANAKSVLDLGGNDGRYSRVATKLGLMAVCTDIDPNAVEANYRFVRHHKEQKLLPLVVDLTNPGGALGWANAERQPIHERLQVDIAMALAIVHHLAISNNLPLNRIAEYFAQFAQHLIIEFVPKDDSQVQKLLSTRDDIFPDYTEDGLKTGFGNAYELIREDKIKGSKRTLYLFKRK